MEKVAGCAGRASPLIFGRLDKTDLRAGRLANSYFMLKELAIRMVYDNH